MKIIYAGSPQAAANTLKILIENQSNYNFEIAAVLSNPPSAKGRHKELTPTPTAALAMEAGIPVYTPEHLNSEAREQIKPLGADLLVCFAYGHIFGPKFLEMFPMGGINLHPSLLPKYRGCTPVPAAILNRDKSTAATIQTLSLKMDEGDILAQEIINLDGTETGESLLNHSAEIGAKLILDVIKASSNSEKKLPAGKKQEGEPSYTSIITKDDGRINWSDSTENIEAKIRAYYPEPGCWTMEKDLPLRILKAEIPSADKISSSYEDKTPGEVVEFNKAAGILIKTGNGLLAVKELQRQGKKAMNYKDFMNGARDFTGTVLQ